MHHIRTIFALIFATALTGCFTSEQQKEIHLLSELPVEVKLALTNSMNFTLDMKPEQFKPEYRHVIRNSIEKSKKTYRLLDSNEPWTPGCTSGARFIKANQSADEWVAQCEQGTSFGRAVYEVHISKTQTIDGVLKYNRTSIKPTPDA